MSTVRYLDSDVVSVYVEDEAGRKSRLATLLWGDSVRYVKKSGDWAELDFTTRHFNETTHRYEWKKHPAFVRARTRFRDTPLMKVRVVDVGQGDAAIIESPKGELVLLDGGEGAHLYNYMSAAWAHVLRTRSIPIAAIVVTHGDADHFAGLPRLVDGIRAGGNPMIVADRVYHNGLVKGSGAGIGILGATKKVDGTTFLTALEDDLLQVPDSRMNAPFRDWKAALGKLKQRNGALTVERLSYGDMGALPTLEAEGIAVQVLGPITEQVGGKAALRALRTPGSGGLSASHTINGHSIVLRMTYGNVRFLFGADLNEESEDSLLARAREDDLSLAAEVLKVPHHGSADFSPRMLEAVRAVVSVVSSGDENGAKEYIHPRAGLVGALGRYARPTVERPLVYVTEMVAFFRRLGQVSAHEYIGGDRSRERPTGTHIQNAYEKTTFGIVHVRTDGERVLVATHSGRADMKEAYAFRVAPDGAIAFEEAVDVV